MNNKTALVLNKITYSQTLLFDCPHCHSKCQFTKIGSATTCSEQGLHHICFLCAHCRGQIITKWKFNEQTKNSMQFDSQQKILTGNHLDSYFPISRKWQPRTNLSMITDKAVANDFEEAINCYNFGFYNSSMIMARRSIQQKLDNDGAEGNNLYSQIEATGISDRLKVLLHKIRNFGNSGAHPDFCLFDKDDNPIDDNKAIAELSLKFLDRYFSEMYELEAEIASAPKCEKER